MRKYATILLVLIIVILAGVGGYYYFFKKPDPTSGWKTYRNEQYGFEVKYPEDWQYYVLPDKNCPRSRDDTLIMLDKKTSELSIPVPPGCYGSGRMPRIWLIVTEENPFPNWDSKYYNNYKSEQFTMGSVIATKISGSLKVDPVFPPVFVVLAEIGKVYLEASLVDPDDSVDLKYFNQILSTFKFTK